MTGPAYDAAWLEQAYRDHLAANPSAPDWGYSFFYCPQERLTSAKIGIIGLNPGGGDIPGNRAWEYREGFAYLDQYWGKGETYNPLQRQIASLIDRLPVTRDEMLAAQLVPFRSPSWARLPGAGRALSTFEPVWRDLLAASSVRLWFSLGYVAGQRLSDWLGAERLDPIPTGWGTIMARPARTADCRVVVSLPHLSRYGVMTSEKCRNQSDAIVRDAVSMANL